MWVAVKDVAEKWTASTQYDLVGLDLFIITSESNVKKVFVIPKLLKGNLDI